MEAKVPGTQRASERGVLSVLARGAVGTMLQSSTSSSGVTVTGSLHSSKTGTFNMSLVGPQRDTPYHWK